MGNAVRDYPIVKIYIQGSNVVGADLPHTETASSKPESLPAVLPTQSLRATDQLFSPTTKKVLDEIATSAEDVGDLNKATTVKKCLKFQEACPLIPAMNNNQPAYQPVTQQMDIMPPSFPTLPNSKDSADVVLQEGKKQVLKCSPVEASDAYGSPVKKLKTKEKLN